MFRPIGLFAQIGFKLFVFPNLLIVNVSDVWNLQFQNNIVYQKLKATLPPKHSLPYPIFTICFRGGSRILSQEGALKKNCAERREARDFFGYFVWKNHDFTPSNHIFSNFRGGAPGTPPPPTPWIRPSV
jgi:hypothetical protein